MNNYYIIIDLKNVPNNFAKVVQKIYVFIVIIIFDNIRVYLYKYYHDLF